MKKLLLGIIAIASLQNVVAQNVGIGTTNPQTKLHVNGKTTLGDSVFISNGVIINADQQITNNNFIEFGKGIPKQTDAGKIGYQTFSTGLDIVGAGTSNTSRRISFFNEGGASFNGNVGVGTASSTSRLDIQSTTGNVLNVSGSNSQIRITENDNGNKQWKFEVNNGNFSIIEDAVATPIVIKAGTDNDAIVTSNDTVTMKKIRLVNGAADGKILTSDANGNAKWAGPIAFSASSNSNQVTPSNQTDVPLFFNTVLYDTYSTLDALSQFTVPSSGIYHCDLRVKLSNPYIPLNFFPRITITVNNVPRDKSFCAAFFNILQLNYNNDLLLNSGDVVRVYVGNFEQNVTIDFPNSWSMHKIN
jgi:hypothetical protein